MVLFPGVAMPVMVGRPKSMRLVKEAVTNKQLIGVVCQKDMDTEEPEFKDLYTTGVVAEIVRVLEMPDGTTTAILQGKKRFRLEELTESEPFLKGRIMMLEDKIPEKKDREFEALISTVKDLTIKMLSAFSEPPRELIFSIKNNRNLIYLVNFSCCNIPSGSAVEKQDLLLIDHLKDRAYRLLYIFNPYLFLNPYLLQQLSKHHQFLVDIQYLVFLQFLNQFLYYDHILDLMLF
jgi:ATP-dependent Lon protease